jgi:hypothetical protein
MGREFPQKYLRSKRAIRKVSGFGRVPGISLPNSQKKRSKQGLSGNLVGIISTNPIKTLVPNKA